MLDDGGSLETFDANTCSKDLCLVRVKNWLLLWTRNYSTLGSRCGNISKENDKGSLSNNNAHHISFFLLLHTSCKLDHF